MKKDCLFAVVAAVFRPAMSISVLAALTDQNEIFRYATSPTAVPLAITGPCDRPAVHLVNTLFVEGGNSVWGDCYLAGDPPAGPAAGGTTASPSTCTVAAQNVTWGGCWRHRWLDAAD